MMLCIPCIELRDLVPAKAEAISWPCPARAGPYPPGCLW